jgi:predicted dehydrogenase
MSDKVRMAVIGTGHFGTFHAQKIAASDRANLVAVADIDPERAAAVGAALNVPAVTDYRELLGKIDAASITVPTHAHFEVARECLDNGIHVLVEKPITDRLATADDLIALAKARNCVLQVGHLVRFSGVSESLRRHATQPLYIDSVRITPFSGRSTDINVVLDLMIHDIDLVLSLVNAPILSIDAAGAPVFTDQEDICSARIKFANGCIATITASRISFKTERRMRIFQPNSYLSVNFDAQTLTVARRAAGDSPRSAVDISEEKYEEVDALAQEIESFIDCVREGRRPVVDGELGRQALEAALIATRELQAHARFVMDASHDPGLGKRASS